uniref:Uncharacterized protein n=1 Tax=Pithovirus LCPAC101 TaxID=2506586 RepID=A0A481Z2Z3_9VIRU|nr:MAG: hypothetical protein LCPAC101_00040 [Pithovirus LCPAC101]
MKTYKVAMSLYFSHFIKLHQNNQSETTEKLQKLNSSFDYAKSMSMKKLQGLLTRLDEENTLDVTHYTSPSKIEMHMRTMMGGPLYLSNILGGNSNSKISKKYNVQEIQNICGKYTHVQLMNIAKDKI